MHRVSGPALRCEQEEITQNGGRQGHLAIPCRYASWQHPGVFRELRAQRPLWPLAPGRRPCTGAWPRRVQATARAAMTGALCNTQRHRREQGYKTYAAASDPEPYGARRRERGTQEAALLCVCETQGGRLPSTCKAGKASQWHYQNPGHSNLQESGRRVHSEERSTGSEAQLWNMYVAGSRCWREGHKASAHNFHLHPSQQFQRSACFGPPLYARLGRRLGVKRQRHSALGSTRPSVATVQAGSALDAPS